MPSRAFTPGWRALVWAWFALAARSPLGAQIKKSQHATVSQTIAATTVTIDYNRPTARGRDLFGALVPYGKEWHPGANEATTITVSKDVLVAGQRLPAGSYTLWAVPDTAEWTLIFSKATKVWHTPYPAGQDLLRIKVKAEKAGFFMETLAYYFPMVDEDSATLALHWGDTVVRMPLKAPTAGVSTR